MTIYNKFEGSWAGSGDVTILSKDNNLNITHKIPIFVKITKVITVSNTYLINIVVANEEINLLGYVLDDKLFTTSGENNNVFQNINGQLVQNFNGASNNDIICATYLLDRLLG